MVNSSMMTNMAVLLNNPDMMKECNLIQDQDEILDPWFIDTVARKKVKKALTPILYGSSAKIRSLIVDDEGEVDYEAVVSINNELQNGKYKNAVEFRDFILNNCMTKPEMTVTIYNETFDIYCNRFKWDISDNIEQFLCWDSELEVFIPIRREVKRVPDISTFNLYMVTLLLHNIDSQIANCICKSVPCLPIHDAFIMHPRHVEEAKKNYLSILKEIYHNRVFILDNYFTSIGIVEPFKHNMCESLVLSSNSLR